MYKENKCIALTGLSESEFFRQNKALGEYKLELDSIYSKYTPKESIIKNIAKYRNYTSNNVPSTSRIIEVMEKYNHKAFGLFNGSYSTGDASKDDFQLLLFLNSFTHGNHDLMRELFLMSALNRKDDRNKRKTEVGYLKYLDNSIKRAISRGNNRYWDYSFTKKEGAYLE